MGDLHVPYHDEQAVEAAVRFARRYKPVGILLNGDVVDMYNVSPFFREPKPERLADELRIAQQMLRWLRQEFPRARMVYREGNHEWRLRRYVVQHADMLADLPCLHWSALLELEKVRVEWIDDKRLVRLGHLATLHGHELPRGGGVNPARYVYLKTAESVLVGHWHRTSQHVERTLHGRTVSTWTVGCLCDLSPYYNPYGQSNHGFALVQIEKNGFYQVQNFRVRQGRIE